MRTIGVVVDGAADADVPRPVTSQSRAAARRLLGITGDQLVVDDFVATISALARRDVTGVWVGSGELAEETARLARTAGSRVVFCGERADVAAVLPALDVFALPSRYEGLPIAVAEAMASGVFPWWPPR